MIFFDFRAFMQVDFFGREFRQAARTRRLDGKTFQTQMKQFIFCLLARIERQNIARIANKAAHRRAFAARAGSVSFSADI